jgi:4'-phosphopantetheinyl transferase EntD
MRPAAPALGRDPWIGDLFPPGVRTASSPPVDCEEELFPEERALVARAVPPRRRQFATGRACARRLLEQFGVPQGPLLRRADRSPRWPAGHCGSISHCEDLCVVAVARCEVARALGVDVEPAEPLEAALWPRILTACELAWLEGRPAAERGRLARLVFSAKESVYKCVRGAGGPELGFQDVEIEFAPGAGRFRAAWTAAGAALEGDRPEGAFAFRGRWLFTGASLG